MDIIGGIKDWVSFRSMITPIILKVLYQVCFFVLNIFGLLFIAGVCLMVVLGGTGGQDSSALLFAVLMAVVFFAIGMLVLIIYNVFLRMYFELVLLLFNMYDELKKINDNTRKEESKAAKA